jgi:CRISPR-associated protein Csb1
VLLDAVFDVLTREAETTRWQSVLAAMNGVERVQAGGTGFKVGPCPTLSPGWLDAAGDDSPEWRLALALGSATGEYKDGRSVDSVRAHALPLDPNRDWSYAIGADNRLVKDPRVVMTGRDPLGDLIALVERRVVEASRLGSRTLPLVARSGAGARLGDLARFLAGEVDVERVVALGRALMAVAWKRARLPSERVNPYDDRPDEAWEALRLCALPFPVRDRAIATEPAMVRRLATGDTAGAVEVALRRLRASGLRPPLVSAVADATTARRSRRAVGPPRWLFLSPQPSPPPWRTASRAHCHGDRMTVDLSKLDNATRLLFSIDLQPVQGDRFQPAGFPSLGAATYQTREGQKLLVESAQSMANRLEATVWDAVNERPVAALDGVSHVTVKANGKFLTDTMLEAHRLNSPYILEAPKSKFVEDLKKDLGVLENGPIKRNVLAGVLLKYDIGSLLHGVFLAKKELAGGRLRVARALSAFIEASNARVAASGGVKNDHVNPAGDTSEGFGNVPFARDEFTAERIVLHVNFDLAQVRGYGLRADAERLLVLLGLYRLRKLIDGDLRLRTACDLEPVTRNPKATRPDGFMLPSLAELEADLGASIKSNRPAMRQTETSYDVKIEPAKKSKGSTTQQGDEDDETNGDD